MIAAVIRAAVTATRESGGFDALMVTALATVALAAVGIISIVTN